MAAISAETIADSDFADDLHLMLDFGMNIDAAEYARIMRRIGVEGDETVTQVSAFNSAI